MQSVRRFKLNAMTLLTVKNERKKPLSTTNDTRCKQKGVPHWHLNSMNSRKLTSQYARMRGRQPKITRSRKRVQEGMRNYRNPYDVNELKFK